MSSLQFKGCIFLHSRHIWALFERLKIHNFYVAQSWLPIFRHDVDQDQASILLRKD